MTTERAAAGQAPGEGGVRVRAMSVEDLPAVYRLGQRCYDVLDKPYNYWTVREVAHHLEANPALCYVAVAGDERVVGFALGERDFEVIEDTGHLEWVAVDPEHRRHGVASRLIEQVIEEYRRMGKARVVADIASKNLASQAFARQNGFREGISVTFFARELGEEAG